MSAPRVKLTELRGYISERTGATYFAGYLGKARVVMLHDDRAEITGRGKARRNVLLEEKEPRVGPGSSVRRGERRRPREDGRAASAACG